LDSADAQRAIDDVFAGKIAVVHHAETAVNQSESADRATNIHREASSQDIDHSREQIEKATGVKFPGEWKPTNEFGNYNNGKPITESGTMDLLKDKQIASGPLNYVLRLYNAHMLKPEDIHLAPDGKHLLFGIHHTGQEKVIWSIELKNKGFFASLFSGRGSNLMELLTHRQGGATLNPEPIINTGNEQKGSFAVEYPDKHNIGATNTPANAPLHPEQSNPGNGQFDIERPQELHPQQSTPPVENHGTVETPHPADVSHWQTDEGLSQLNGDQTIRDSGLHDINNLKFSPDGKLSDADFKFDMKNVPASVGENLSNLPVEQRQQALHDYMLSVIKKIVESKTGGGVN
jgi:hypothetical protein